MSTSAKNALRLKMAGLMITLAGFAAFPVLGDHLGDLEEPLAAAPRDYVFIAGAWLIAAHVFAAGLIVLLAGLKDVPLLTSARARRGALRKLAGSTLIILCFGYVGLKDVPAFKTLDKSWWILLPGLALFLISARAGFQLLRSGWKYDVISADQLLASDPRPPVVYLRSFEADDEILLRPEGFWSKAVAFLIGYAVTFSPEQELAEILSNVGPVIAIGKPGEPLPELGAARLYVGDADWKAKVTDMMARSRLVIIRTGSTPNLEWEIDQAMTRVPRRQILFVSLGNARKTAVFDEYFERHFGRANSIGQGSRGAALDEADLRGQVHNREDRLLRSVAATARRADPAHPELGGPGAGSDAPVSRLDSNRDETRILRARITLGYAQQPDDGGPARDVRRIVRTALFLSGDRRRGFICLAFCWTAIPMFVGWYDTVKFGTAESQAFDRGYPLRQVVPMPSSSASAMS